MTVQVSSPYTDPERVTMHSVTGRQTDRQTDNSIMPIIDLVQYDWLQSHYIICATVVTEAIFRSYFDSREGLYARSI